MNKDEDLLIKSDKLEKEAISQSENNLMLSLVPILPGTGSGMAVGVQLQEYVDNKMDDDVKGK